MDRNTMLQIGLYFFELLACVMGFVYWKKIKNTYWKWFPIYLAVIVLLELTGKFLIEFLDDPSRSINDPERYRGTNINAGLYRYFGIPIQFLFFFWLFWRYFSNKKEYRWPMIGAAIYVLSWFAEMLLFQKQQFWFMSFSYTIGNIVLLVLIILFFVRFINSENILKYKQSMMFWVCFGLMAFYLVTFPFYALRNTLWKSNRSVFYIYSYVSMGLDYLMYIFFTISFIWGRPK
jgi:hypothetical protein